MRLAARSIRRLPARRSTYVPRARPWLPAAYVIEEIEPRASHEWFFVHKIEGVLDEDGDPLGTVWASERAMITGSSDTPADTTFPELIDEPGDYRCAVFDRGRVPGLVSPTWGGCTWKNTDGRLDAWADYATDGAKITCYFGPRGGAFPAEWRKVFIAYVDGYPSFSGRAMTLQFRGRERRFDRRVQQRGFDGTLGTEGGVSLEAAGIPGSRLPLIVMGEPPAFRPILTNDVTGVWLLQDNINDSAVNGGLPRLFDGGSELTYGGPIGSGLGPSTFAMTVRGATGPVMVQPTSEVRVELRAKSSGLYSTPTVTKRAWTICDLATIAGVPVDSTKMASGSTNYGCGNRLVETETVKEVLADIAAFQVASIGFTRLDQFYAKPIIPSWEGSSVYTFRDAGTYPDGNSDEWTFKRLDGMEKRVWQIKARGGATTRSALVAITDDDIRDELSRDPFMVNFTADITFNSGPPYYQASTVLDTDPSAEVLEVEIAGHQFADETEREAFALRYAKLFCGRSIGCTLSAPFSLQTMQLELLDNVTLQTSRYGGARQAIIVFRHSQLKRRRIGFTCWSHNEDTAPGAGEISITRVDDTVGAGGNGGGTGVTGGGDAAPQLEHVHIYQTDKTSAITTGTKDWDWFPPYAVTLDAFRGGVSTAQASGTALVFDAKVNGASILSTKSTITNGQKVGAAAVISAPSIPAFSHVTFSIDAAGTGGKGAFVSLVYHQAPG